MVPYTYKKGCRVIYGSDTLQARIRLWFGRFGPDFMLPAAAIALVVVLLLLWEDKDEDKP